MILADVSGDGRLDLLTAHQQDRVIRVHLGDGVGGFRMPVSQQIILPFGPGDMKVVDVDGNKTADLAVTATDHDIVTVLLGDGRGTFRTAAGSPFVPHEAAYPYNKRAIHVVDINQDGRIDILTTNRRGQSEFRFFLGNGDGSFSRGPVLRLDESRPTYTFGFGDVDNDGHVDVLAVTSGRDQSNDPAELSVYRSNGGGQFKELTAWRTKLPPRARIEAVADTDGDDLLDVMLSHENSALTILRNQVGASFTLASDSPCDVGRRVHAIVVTDMNGDRKPDLATATENSVAIMLATATGCVHAPGSPFIAGPGAFHLWVSDMDGDRKPDVVASSFESPAVTVLLQRH